MMLYLYPFIKGLITGITIAAIGGPIGILCIRKSINESVWIGIALGIGAAIADSLFGSIAAFGITIISDFLLRHQYSLSLAGSCFLIYLGISTLLEQQHNNVIINLQRKGLLQSVVTSFFITITNPTTILFFTATSVSLGIGVHNYWAAFAMVLGIFFRNNAMVYFIILDSPFFQTQDNFISAQHD